MKRGIAMEFDMFKIMKSFLAIICFVVGLWSFSILIGGCGQKEVIPHDNIPPTIVTVTPTSGATAVATNTIVSVTFSESMDNSTMNASNFSLYGASKYVAGAINYDANNKTMNFTPTNNLDGNTTYVATVAAGVKDLAGNQMTSPYSWSFTTGAQPDTTPPTVTMVFPANGTYGVDLNIQISAKFSKSMNSSTINNSTFTLRSNSGTVSGLVAYNAATRTATFTPAKQLAKGVFYAATISAEVKDSAGNSLDSDYSWSFITRDGSWGVAELIETTLGTAENPQIAMDPNGNGIAVWGQCDFPSNIFNIYANLYVPGTGWGMAGTIESDNAGDAEHPQIAMDQNGNAIAVWYQSDGVRKNIWANHYAAGTGWGMAGTIESDNAGDAKHPQIAMAPNGNAIAVWFQSDGVRNNIWANRCVAGNWMGAQLIETDAGNAFDPQIAMDPNGNAIAVWMQNDGSYNSIYANRCVGGNWGTAQLIETNDGAAQAPQIAMYPNGDAIAVWEQNDGSYDSIYANRCVAGNWMGAQPIETGTGNASFPQIAADPNGNAIAVWSQKSGSYNRIYSNRCVTGNWMGAQTIEIYTGNAGLPEIAIDPNGNAIAVWHQYDGYDRVYSNRYIAGAGWGTAQTIETNDNPTEMFPQIAIDPNGNGIAVWHKWDGTRINIWSNRFE